MRRDGQMRSNGNGASACGRSIKKDAFYISASERRGKMTEDRIEWRRFMTSPYRPEEEEEALV